MKEITIVEGKGGELPPERPAGCTSYRAPLGGGGTKSLEKFSRRKEPAYHNIAGKRQKGGKGPKKSRGQAPRRQSSRVHPGPPSAILVSDCVGPLVCSLWRSAPAPPDST